MIIERTVQPGKFRVQIPGKPLSVSLIGLRGRPFHLRRMDQGEFTSRISMTPEGEIRNDHVIRGTPSSWEMRGTMLYLWPFPTHEWKVRVEIEDRKEPVAAE